MYTPVREDDWDVWDGWDPKRPSFGCPGLGWSSYAGSNWAGFRPCTRLSERTTGTFGTFGMGGIPHVPASDAVNLTYPL